MNILKFKKCVMRKKKMFTNKIFLLSLLYNKRVMNLLKILNKLKKKNIYMNRYRKTCLVTGRFRSVHTLLYMKRHTLKKTLTLNNVPNIKKLSW